MSLAMESHWVEEGREARECVMWMIGWGQARLYCTSFGDFSPLLVRLSELPALLLVESLVASSN